MNKKPIERVNFSKIKKTIGLPDLIEVQKDSFKFFLQSELEGAVSMAAPVTNRIEQGLEEVFREIFPIADFNETSVLEYISYSIEPAKYSPRESIDRNTTYAAPLKIRVRLVTYISEEGMTKPVVKAGKESEVYLCDIPLMTERGTFVINGVERVIVSQLHRSPGIFFEDASAGKSVTEKHMYSARIIPYRGSWVDFEFDSKNILYVRIDKKRKIPVTVLLKALGMSEQDILSTYYKTESIHFEENGFSKAFDADKIRNQRFTTDVLDSDGEAILKANYAVTKASIRRMQKAGIKTIRLTAEDLAESYFASNITTAEGEVLVDANSDVTEEKLDLLAASNITDFEILLIDRANADSVIRDILAIDKIKTPEEAQIEIYKKMRPGEPATEDAARTLFQNLFFNEKRYDLSRVGRLKINKRLGLDIPLEVTTLTREDIVETVRVLENIRVGNDRIDDIDHLGHRRVRAAGEQLQNHIRIGLARMEKTVKERMSIHDVEELTPQDLLNAKPLSASIKEFFGGYQLSQFMDQTNPLSEVTHKRRLSALGPGGLNRDRAGFEVRDVHTSHYGRICPIETPEGPNIGLITSLTTYAKINEFGFIET
ncbi:MAG: DNA-directed RNA polymerase subunit beta, partial [Deferribacteraceae bacterium]|nr:DNA-directed RNA polymerase subunit beta [Deferribacteraceae bacterium]